MSDEAYSQDQAQKILEIALARQARAIDGMRHEELVSVASDMGLSRQDIETAIAISREDHALEHEVVAIQQRRRRKLLSHLSSFTIVNVALFLIDMLTVGGPWFYWPLIGWGIGVAFHIMSTLMPDHEKDRAKAQRRIESRQAKEARRLRREQRNLALQGIAQTVEDGTAQVVDALTQYLKQDKSDHRPR